MPVKYLTILRITVVSVLLSLTAARHAAGLQQAGSRSTDSSPRSIAVLPWRFSKGSSRAARTGRETVNALLTNAKLNLTPDQTVLDTWKQQTGSAWSDGEAEMPTRDQMLAVGRSLGVDLVAAGEGKWRTRSVWIAFGPKTKSECTINCLILDVKTGEAILTAKDVKMDDTAREDVIKTLGGTWLSGVFSVNVLGGDDRTPHEQRAVQFAVARALKPWLEQRSNAGKI